MPTVSAPRALRRVRSRVFELEAALLRASVDALAAVRPTCRHCHRTPLVGERVHFYESRNRTDVVCELCRPLRNAAPDRSELVRSPEQGQSVQAVER
ncbi:MAG: hypothetical protein QOG77_1390 [Solirubrobacteraceae bacterium]|nr:hypothetical protein [Solirubrobacteraceae bacterium]